MLNCNLLCGSNSSRQAASISRGEKSSLQPGDLLLASETARSVRRKRVSLLTCVLMLAELCESISSVLVVEALEWLCQHSITSTRNCDSDAPCCSSVLL